MFAIVAQLIALHAETKIPAQAVNLASLNRQKTLALSPSQCARKPVVTEKDLSMLVTTETPTIMTAAIINVKSNRNGAVSEEQRYQKVFAPSSFQPEA